MPTASNYHNDTFLTNVAVGYFGARFIAPQIFPVVIVDKETGKVPVFGRDNLRIEDADRAMGAEIRGTDYDVSSVSYACKERSLDHPVDYRVSGLQDDPFRAQSDGVRFLSDVMSRNLEIILATMLTTTANYPTGHYSATALQWDQATAGDCVAHVLAAKTQIVKSTGGAADDSMMYGIATRPVFDVLQNHAKVIAKWAVPNAAASAPARLTTQQVAQALGLVDIFVGNVSYNTALQGATESLSWAWGAETFIVFSRTPSPGLYVPNFGYTLIPSIAGGGAELVYADPVYWNAKRKSDMVGVTSFLDFKMTCGYHGFLYTNTLGAS